MDITKAVYTLLSGDAGLIALLGTFQSNPCIFTGELVPPDADRPYIWTHGNVADEPDDDKTLNGRVITRDFLCVADGGHSSQAIETLADTLRDLLHRNPISLNAVTEGNAYVASVSGPFPAETDRTLEGRILTATWTIEEV